MDDCIFCKIARGDVPAKIVYRDRDAVAIEDLSPQAPVHLLVLPVEHFADVVAAAAHPALFGSLLGLAARLGQDRSDGRGFRVVVNTGPEGGQTVPHLHLHVLAGRRMTWPPG